MKIQEHDQVVLTVDPWPRVIAVRISGEARFKDSCLRTKSLDLHSCIQESLPPPIANL